MSKKRWGQNFLVNKKIIKSIIQVSGVKTGDQILEVGPGKGILTQALLEQDSKVKAIEIDPKCCSYLKNKFKKEKKFSLIEKDVMTISQESLQKLIPTSSKLVSNLPYNIATQLLLKLLPLRKSLKSLTLIIQKEVAERICANPNSGKAYGTLSLVGELGFYREIIRIIPPYDFRPIPKVDSALIHLLPKDSGLDFENEKKFLRWNQLLFQQRRKKLINGIRQHFPDWYSSCGNSINKMFGLRRPENLDFTEWMQLFNYYLKNEKDETV